MIDFVTVTNHLGDSIKMELRNPWASGLNIKNITGLEPPKATINSTEVATSDGAIYNSARLSTRNIVLSLAFLPMPDIETTRQKTYKYFPIKKPVTLEIKTDNRHVKTLGYVESNTPEIFSKDEATQISLICPDPYFYEVSDDENGNGATVTNFSNQKPLFEFPFSNESLTVHLLEFGTIEYNTARVITYDGDAETGVRIYIHALGPATNITIYNTQTREQMAIDTNKLAAVVGSPIQAGDDIIISTIRGNKYIRLIRGGTTYNILNALSRNSSWFTLVNGDNLFGYRADNGSTNLQIRMENYTLFEGV